MIFDSFLNTQQVAMMHFSTTNPEECVKGRKKHSQYISLEPRPSEPVRV